MRVYRTGIFAFVLMWLGASAPVTAAGSPTAQPANEVQTWICSFNDPQLDPARPTTVHYDLRGGRLIDRELNESYQITTNNEFALVAVYSFAEQYLLGSSIVMIEFKSANF